MVYHIDKKSSVEQRMLVQMVLTGTFLRPLETEILMYFRFSIVGVCAASGWHQRHCGGSNRFESISAMLSVDFWQNCIKSFCSTTSTAGVQQCV